MSVHRDHRNADHSGRLVTETIFHPRTRVAVKKKVVVSTALVTAALAAGGLLYFTHTQALEKAAAAPAPPKVPIVAATVAQHDVPIYLSGVGTVIAYNTD